MSKDASCQPFSLPSHKNENKKNTLFNYFVKEYDVKRRKVESTAIQKVSQVSSAQKKQTYINIGQKNFGPVKCESCGMVYSKHTGDEDQQHRRFHQHVVNKLTFPGWKDERIAQEFHDGRIVIISSCDQTSHLKKLAEVKEVVDADLGFAEVQSSGVEKEQQAYLFISSKKVVGYALCFQIDQAYPIESDGANSLLTTDTNSNLRPDDFGKKNISQSWTCSSSPVSAFCGISRLWVFSENRRFNIATRLVDCIRLNFLYGCVVEKEKLAFSDPTPNGKSFAEKYMGGLRVLVFR